MREKCLRFLVYFTPTRYHLTTDRNNVSTFSQQARESNRQLDARRFRLEGALEDLRQRTLDNERLENQAKVMRGEVNALRELADERGLEVKELRDKLAR